MSHHVCQAQNRHKCPIYKDLSHFFALNTFDAGINMLKIVKNFQKKCFFMLFCSFYVCTFDFNI